MLLCFSLTASQRVPTAHPDNDVSDMEKSLGPCQNLDVPLQLQLQALWSPQRHLCHEGLCLCRSFWGGTSAGSLFLRLFVDFPSTFSCKFGNLDTKSGVVQHSLFILLVASHSLPSNLWEPAELKPHYLGSEGVTDLVEMLSRVTPPFFTACYMELLGQCPPLSTSCTQAGGP